MIRWIVRFEKTYTIEARSEKQAIGKAKEMFRARSSHMPLEIAVGRDRECE